MCRPHSVTVCSVLSKSLASYLACRIESNVDTLKLSLAYSSVTHPWNYLFEVVRALPRRPALRYIYGWRSAQGNRAATTGL